MTTPRLAQIDLDFTPYYHCMSRCVRQSYICGIDKLTGKDYNHRKQWIVDRLKLLTSVFCIDVCAYAVMSNHYHVVLKVNKQKADKLTDEAIIERWQNVYHRNAKMVSELVAAKAPLAESACDKIREQLTSISHFMKALNEYIALLSNKEDECKGRFWDGRFKSQALLDEGAILTAMAYVDLNPIRAGIAQTPEESEFTSVYERIQKYTKTKSNAINDQPMGLVPLFTDDNNEDTFDFDLKDYLALVDETGRILRDDKKGYIPAHLSPILKRLDLEPKNWLNMVNGLQKNFYYAVGKSHILKEFTGTASNKHRQIINAESCYLEEAA